MRRFSVSLTIVIFTLLLVSVSSAQMSNPAVSNLMGYNGILNLGLLTDSSPGTPASQSAIGPGTPGQKQIPNTPARAPIVSGSGTIHPVVWITDINGDTSHSPELSHHRQPRGRSVHSGLRLHRGADAWRFALDKRPKYGPVWLGWRNWNLCRIDPCEFWQVRRTN